MTMNKRKRISTIIKELKKALDKHGNLFVYYSSDYDWVLPIYSVEVVDEKKDPTNWENAPKEKVLYLG